MPKPETAPLSYRDAGVDIDAGNRLVDNIKPFVTKTHTKAVLTGLGGFGALYELPKGYQNPVLVSATDGVGTKLKLAVALKQHETIGIDLVAMCANDLVTLGAQPLFFLDYYATGHLNLAVASHVIKGIAEGCEQANMALVGGETAEMPSVYTDTDYDLAGFCVGIVEKNQIIDGKQVQVGDVLLGLAASGPHSNGYALIRKVLETTHADLHASFGDSTLGQTLLTPTKIYVKAIQAVLSEVPVHAMAHITGGGLTENLPRVLPNSTQAEINSRTWDWPEIFTHLQVQGNIAHDEMLRTFNCGIGMVLCLPAAAVEQAQSILADLGETSYVIGKVTHSDQPKAHVVFTA